MYIPTCSNCFKYQFLILAKAKSWHARRETIQPLPYGALCHATLSVHTPCLLPSPLHLLFSLPVPIPSLLPLPLPVSLPFHIPLPFTLYRFPWTIIGFILAVVATLTIVFAFKIHRKYSHIGTG